MRRVVVGTDGEGRSSVVDDGPPPVAFGSVHELWSYVPGAAPTADDPTRTMSQIVDAPRPGGAAWRVSVMGPGEEGVMHRTPTVDFDVVLEGRVTLVLESGEVDLEAGDLVVLPGSLHAWRTGPDDGCAIAFVNVHTKAARG